ncbi:unnamed protein product [Mortierella alpina]
MPTSALLLPQECTGVIRPHSLFAKHATLSHLLSIIAQHTLVLTCLMKKREFRHDDRAIILPLERTSVPFISVTPSQCGIPAHSLVRHHRQPRQKGKSTG